MTILVVWASRHGATKEVADVVREELSNGGHEVTLKEASEVTTLDNYDGVVLGSAVYLTQWVDTMRRFVSKFSKQLREKHLWAFSVGLSGVPGGNVVDPVRVGPVLLRINPIDETTFAGRLEPRELSLRERSVARLGGAQEGDYRDWDEIRRWSRSVSDMAKTL